VREFYPDEGWGVIDGPDVPGGCWVHFSAIAVAGYTPYLVAGGAAVLESGSLVVGTAAQVYLPRLTALVTEFAASQAGISTGLTAAGTTAAATRIVPQITQNREHGISAAKAFAEFLKKNGMNVVGQEISVWTPFGRRQIDIVVQIGNRTHGIEVKSGNATTSVLQFAKDRWINLFGGAKAVGERAAEAGVTRVDTTVTVFVP